MRGFAYEKTGISDVGMALPARGLIWLWDRVAGSAFLTRFERCASGWRGGINDGGGFCLGSRRYRCDGRLVVSVGYHRRGVGSERS